MSSPYAVVTLPGDNGSELGKTEVIHADLSPQWTNIFFLEHNESQSWTPIKITLHDCRASRSDDNTDTNNRGSRMSFAGAVKYPYAASDPTMGVAEAEAGEVLKREGQEVRVELEQGGCLYVHVTESVPSSPSGGLDPAAGEFHCHIRGLDFQNIESGILGLGAIDPYFELSKKFSDPNSGINRWVPVYRSENIPDIINPYWRPFKMDLERLCHCDLRRELKIAVWDQEDGAKADRWMGECVVCAELLMKSVTMGGNASRENALHIMNNDQKEIGLIVVLRAEIVDA